MPTPKPLSPTEASSTLAQRLTRKADQLRQLNTKFGLRPDRVFLVWTQWSGAERGEGTETVKARIEITPTPRVSDVSGISRRPYSLGVFPEGTVRVDQISSAVFTDDILRGLDIPTPVDRPCGSSTACGPVYPWQTTPVRASGVPPVERTTDPRVDFWYEIVEDGRGGDPEQRHRYRLLGSPNRNPGRFQWALNLERASESLDRTGHSQIGTDASETRDLLEQPWTPGDD